MFSLHTKRSIVGARSVSFAWILKLSNWFGTSCVCVCVCATVLPQSGSLSPALNFNHCNVPVHKLPRHAHTETRTCVAFGQESLDSMGGRKEAALYRGNIPAELAQWPCLSPRSASACLRGLPVLVLFQLRLRQLPAALSKRPYAEPTAGS